MSKEIKLTRSQIKNLNQQQTLDLMVSMAGVKGKQEESFRQGIMLFGYERFLDAFICACEGNEEGAHIIDEFDDFMENLSKQFGTPDKKDFL